MKKAYRKDIWRTISRTKKRFLSILLITALGITVFIGIHAACLDMYQAADVFYDEQNLFDIRILSTLGLTEEDVNALKELPEIAVAEGSYSEEVDTEVAGTKATAVMTLLSEKQLNMPSVLAGTLPEKGDEIAVTSKYLTDTGKQIGDTIEIKERLDETENETEQETEEERESEWDTDIEIDEEEEAPTFSNSKYTITAEVLDPMDINNATTAFRSSSSADYTFFVTGASIRTDVYSSVYITLSDMRELDCYGEDYENAVQAVIKRIENEMKDQREQARYDEIITEARGKIEDAENTMNEKFAEVDEEISDAWDDIEQGKQDLAEGESELTGKESEAEQKIADAKTELENGKTTLTKSEAELKKGEAEIEKAKKQIETSEAELKKGKKKLAKEQESAAAQFEAAEKTFQEKQTALDDARASAQAGVAQLQEVLGSGWPAVEWNALVNAAATKTTALLSANPDAEVDTAAVASATLTEQGNLSQAITGAIGSVVSQDELNSVISSTVQAAIQTGVIEGGQQALNAGKTTYEAEKEKALQELSSAAEKLAKGEDEIAGAKVEIAEKEKEIESGWTQIGSGWQEINGGTLTLSEEEAKAKKEIADAWDDLEDGKQELAEGETELIQNEEQYLEKRAEAEQKIADAYEELQDIDMTEWYVQDRTNVDSYSSLETDMSSIEVIGKTIPIVFIIVAVLISLTTMTRMIEEERGLIGTYKALGFGNGSIYGKYIIYAASACVAGAVLGAILGFTLFPMFLVDVLLELYILPNMTLCIDIAYFMLSLAIFIVAIVGATILACRSELKRMPAALMRPKAPQNGSRVFLERIPFIWKRLKFLNKVTVRNLFRYKKRFFMTVFGIMGCTALIIAGFGIKSSVTVMMPKQYEDIYKYDVMAVVDAKDNETLVKKIGQEANISDYLSLRIDSYKVLSGAEKSENAQLMVIPDGVSLTDYLGITDQKGNEIVLGQVGAVLTINAAELLGVKIGDTVTLQNLQLEEHSVTVTGVANNYLGNNIYISQSLYEEIWGSYQPNAALINIADECEDKASYSEGFLDDDIFVGSLNVSQVRIDLMEQFTLMDAVVTMIIIFAAGLAFVVLFTLSNTNISERVRELATTKVLGFYDNEVHSYVNKETLILTGIGILVGLPAGWVLSDLLTSALKMPALYFATYVEPTAYVYAAVLSFGFAMLVNLMTNRVLNRINMVEALKSVE